MSFITIRFVIRQSVRLSVCQCSEILIVWFAPNASYQFTQSKKGLVYGVNVLYGHRIRLVDPQELKQVYGVPDILVPDNGNQENLRPMQWVKCQYVLQTVCPIIW